MIHIPYFLLLSFLGVIIMSNIGNISINRLLTQIGLCIVAMLGLIPLEESTYINFLGFPIQAISQDSPSYYCTIVFTLTLVCGGFFYLSFNKINFKEIGFAFILAGCAITAVSSKDLIVVIILIQIIPIISAIMVAMNNSAKSKRTAIQILVVNLFGNLLFIIGAESYINITGGTTIQNLIALDHYSRYLMLAGLLVLVATPPFASWFVDEISVSSAKSAIFLSIFTPKVALILLIKMFAGETALLYIGILLTFYGLIFSLFTPNLRKILAYAIIHQVGFILIVLSISRELNLYALNTFMFSHIIYELCFFIIAAICHDYFKHDNIHKMQGFFHFNSLMGILLLLASLNSLGFPFTSGFIGKTLISDIMYNSGNQFILYFTFFSAAAHALHIGFKIFYWLYLKNPEKQNIELFKKHTIPIQHIIPIGVLIGITIIHYIIASMLTNTKINSLENIYHEIRVAIIGLIMFAFLLKFTNHEKEHSIYEMNHTIIMFLTNLLFHSVNYIRNFVNTIGYNSQTLLIKMAKSTLILQNIYLNSRLILFILLSIIFFSILLYIY